MKWILVILIPLLQGCYSSTPINAPSRERIVAKSLPPYSGSVNLFGLYFKAGSEKWEPHPRYYREPSPAFRQLSPIKRQTLPPLGGPGFFVFDRVRLLFFLDTPGPVPRPSSFFYSQPVNISCFGDISHRRKLPFLRNLPITFCVFWLANGFVAQK